MPALRVFRCRECGHRMRLAGRLCGRCHARKGLLQSRAIVIASGSAIMILCTVNVIVLAAPSDSTERHAIQASALF